MSEDELAAEIAKEVKRLGIMSYHPHDSRRDMPGWPDLVLWSRGGLIYRELKSTLGRVSQDQRLIGASLAQAGADWAVWRPEDWNSGRISRELNQLVRIRHITS